MFLSKYGLKVVKVKECDIKQEGSKTFEKSLVQNRECLKIANLVNTKVVKIIKYQPKGVSYHL